MLGIFKSKAFDRLIVALLNVSLVLGILISTAGSFIAYAESEETLNVALNKPVTAMKTSGGVAAVNKDRPVGMATDGIVPNNSASSNYCDFGEDNKRESLYLQVDLGEIYDISEIKMWRYWDDGRTYENTAIVVSEDEEFDEQDTIIYNSDTDNHHGFGEGTDAKYPETKEGKSWEATPIVKGRYVRVYMYGSDKGTTNHIVELEVYAKVPVVIEKKPFTNATEKLDIPCYYDVPGRAPNQSTHPDVQYFPNGWKGYKYWMVFTPNMTGISLYENPSIVASNDGVNWEVPNGLTNPIEPEPESTRYHNCDADLVFNPKTNELWAYWNWADDQSGGVGAEIRVRKSKDGINWSEAETAIKSSKRYDMLSPAIIYDEYRDIFLMWTNNTGDVGYNNGGANFVEMRYSEDGMNWSAPIRVKNFLGKNQAGQQLAPWHQDVQYITELNEYWAVAQCFKLPGNPDGSVLHFTKSKDGINWEPVGTKALLSPGETGSWDDRQIYRTSFIYDNSGNKGYGKGNFRLWYSALQTNKAPDTQLWGIGYTENNYEDVMAALLDEDEYVHPAQVSVDSIKLSAEKTTLTVGEVINATTEILPANASNHIIKYESSDPSVVEVEAFGKITAIKEGTATITATSKDGSKTSSLEIIVSQGENFQWQRFDDTNESIIYSDGWTIEDNARYAKAKDEFAKMTFYGTQVRVIGQKDSNYGYADVYIDGEKAGIIDGFAASGNPTGVTTFESEELDNGLHTIEVRLTGTKPAGSSSTVIDIDAFEVKYDTAKDVDVSEIMLNKSGEQYLEIGKTLKLSSTVNPINATDKSIIWESSDTDVASITDGIITAIGAGSAVITAKSASDHDVTTTLTINAVTEIPKAEMRMKVDNENPLLIIPVYGQSYNPDESVLDWGDTLLDRWNAIPDDVKSNAVIEIHPSKIMSNNIKQFYEQQLEIAQENDIPVILVTVTAGNVPQYTGTATLSPNWARDILERYSCVKGLMSTENYWIYSDGIANVIADYTEVCAEYGAYYIWSEHHKHIIERVANNPKFYNTVSENHENFIFTFKNTPVNDNAGTDSYMTGLWLADICGQWGGLMDTWKWYEKRYNALFAAPFPGGFGPGEEARCIVTEPEALLAIEMINVYANGGVVYNFEHPAYTTGVNNRNTPAFENAILKFFRYAMENPAPSKQDIKDRTKVVFSGKEGQLSTMGNFYSGLNCEDESLPTYTTGRYGIIPAFPSRISEERIAEVLPEATILNKKSPELATKQSKIEFFNSQYPENYKGSAYAQLVDNVWYIYNNRVNVNENQNAKISFDSATVDVTLEPHTYLIAKEQDSTINIQLNNYRVDKDSIWEGYIPGQTVHWDTDHNTLLQEWMVDHYLDNPNDLAKRTTTFTLSGQEAAPTIEKVTGLTGKYDTPVVEFDNETGVATITVASNGWMDFNIVTTPRDTSELRRVIDRENPLYLMNFYWSDDVDQGDTVEKLWSAVPDSLKDVSVILLIAEQSLNDRPTTNPDRPAPREWLLKQTAICEEKGIPYAIQVINGETREALKFPMEFWEDLAKNSKYLYGLNGAELYNRFDGGKDFGAQYMIDIINLTAKYGMYTMWTDTNIFGRSGVLVDWLEDYPELGSTMKQNKKNVVLMNKESYARPETDSLFLGMWLSEYCDNWGTSSDWWHWQLDGNGSLFDGPGGGDPWKQCLTFPDAMYVQDMLRVISMGGTAFKSEAQWYSNATNGVRTPTYQYAIIPFLEKVVNGEVYIPTREEIRDMVQALYVGQKNWQVPYFNYSLSNKYPVSGRYGLIPFLPQNASEQDLSFYKNILREKKDKEYFDSLYPEKTIYTDTFCVNQGDTWYWMNSSEDVDVFLSSQFFPKVNKASLFYIGAEPHTYSVIREETNKINVILGNYRVDKSELWDGTTYPHGFSDPQAYEYIRKISANPNDSAQRETIIKLTGSYKGGEPKVRFDADTEYSRPYKVDKVWDETTQELTIKIRHNGQVEFTIDVDDSIEPIIPAQDISIQKDIKGSIVNVGDEINFTATVSPDIASIKDVDWSIEKGKGDATIDENGLFKALKPGDVRVVATTKDGSDIKAFITINIMGTSDFVQYLSDIEWESAENPEGPTKKDKGFKGDHLNINGEIYAKGLGTHANSTIIYKLNGDYDRFFTIVGIDNWLKEDPDEVKQAAIKFDVYVDGVLKASSPTMKYDMDGYEIAMDVKGANELKLVATTQIGNNWSAYANWADAKVIKYAPKPVVNKEELKEAIDYAEAVKKKPDFEHVIDSVKEELNEALDTAKIVYEDQSADQESVDKALTALINAIEKLSFVGDKTKLNLLIEKAKAIDLDLYVDDSAMKEFIKALDAAQSIAKKQESTQAEVDDALEKLVKALEGLNLKPEEKPVDKALLNATIKSALEIDLQQYRDGTAKDRFIDALVKAQAISAKEGLTQAEVDSANSQLSEAIKGLIIKPESEPKPELVDPEGPEKPGLKDPVKPGKPKGPSLPKTGETFGVWILLLGLALLLIGVRIKVKRKSQ